MVHGVFKKLKNSLWAKKYIGTKLNRELSLTAAIFSDD
jgi:hypothetical protein